MGSRLHSVAVHKASIPVSEDDRHIFGIPTKDMYTGSILPTGQAKPQDIEMTTRMAEEMTELDVHHLEFIVSYLKQHYTECFTPGQEIQSLKGMIDEARGFQYISAPLQSNSRRNLLEIESNFDGTLRLHKNETDLITAIIGFLKFLFRTDRAKGKSQYQNYNFALTIFLPCIYGAIHLTAWSSVFPTMVEHIMWRAACILIMTGIPGVLLVLFFCVVGAFFIAELFPDTSYDDSPHETTSRDWFVSIFGYLALFLGSCLGLTVLISLIAARCFIIVESFMSLRTAPIGVYWTPAWIQMFPHG